MFEEGRRTLEIDDLSVCADWEPIMTNKKQAYPIHHLQQAQCMFPQMQSFPCCVSAALKTCNRNLLQFILLIVLVVDDRVMHQDGALVFAWNLQLS